MMRRSGSSLVSEMREISDLQIHNLNDDNMLLLIHMGSDIVKLSPIKMVVVVRITIKGKNDDDHHHLALVCQDALDSVEVV